MTGNRAINIGGQSVGNVNTTGDKNTVEANLTLTVLPAANSVDFSNEIVHIRAILESLGGDHRTKISRALDDAEEEVRKEKPSKDEIGEALNRAVNYAKKSNGFAEQIGKLAPHIANAVAWLGSNWHPLLTLVGLSV